MKITTIYEIIDTDYENIRYETLTNPPSLNADVKLFFASKILLSVMI